MSNYSQRERVTYSRSSSKYLVTIVHGVCSGVSIATFLANRWWNMKLSKFHSWDLIVIVGVSAARGLLKSWHILYQLIASTNTNLLVTKIEQHRTNFMSKLWPISQNSILAVGSSCISINDRNFLFHHCRSTRNEALDTPDRISC